MDKRRSYPGMCMSAFCGRTDCTGCRFKPILDEFNQWVYDNNAVQVSPYYWEVTAPPADNSEGEGNE